MVIKDDRNALDDALNQDVSICVLVGKSNSVAAKVHACMDAKGWGDEPWHRWFLVSNQQLLSISEIERWFGGDFRHDYVFLGRNTKAVASQGKSQSDLLDGGQCDYITFIEKFAEADLK